MIAAPIFRIDDFNTCLREGRLKDSEPTCSDLAAAIGTTSVDGERRNGFDFRLHPALSGAGDDECSTIRRAEGTRRFMALRLVSSSSIRAGSRRIANQRRLLIQFIVPRDALSRLRFPAVPSALLAPGDDECYPIRMAGRTRRFIASHPVSSSSIRAGSIESQTSGAWLSGSTSIPAHFPEKGVERSCVIISRVQRASSKPPTYGLEVE